MDWKSTEVDVTEEMERELSAMGKGEGGDQ